MRCQQSVMKTEEKKIYEKERRGEKIYGVTSLLTEYSIIAQLCIYTIVQKFGVSNIFKVLYTGKRTIK